MSIVKTTQGAVKGKATTYLEHGVDEDVLPEAPVEEVKRQGRCSRYGGCLRRLLTRHPCLDYPGQVSLIINLLPFALLLLFLEVSRPLLLLLLLHVGSSVLVVEHPLHSQVRPLGGGVHGARCRLDVGHATRSSLALANQDLIYISHVPGWYHWKALELPRDGYH